jgi:hypothetical protein
MWGILSESGVMAFLKQTSTDRDYPRELEDRDWLASRYAGMGDETIAAELRVSSKTVRRARQRLGIATRTAHGASASGMPTNGGAPAGGVKAEQNVTSPSVSGEGVGQRANAAEIAQRVRQVQNGLGNVLAALPRFVDRLEWVRQQLDPHESSPASAPTSQNSGSSPPASRRSPNRRPPRTSKKQSAKTTD